MELGGELAGLLGSSVRNMRITFCASSMRPAALMRGAIWNATWRALGERPFINPESSRMARKPGFLDWFSPSRPCLTMMRFSPTSGHHVGHRGDGHQFQKRLHHARQLFGRPFERREQRLHQLERNAGAAQVLVGIGAVAAIRDSTPRVRAEARRRADDDR